MKDPRLDGDDLAALCEGLLWDVPAGAVSWDEHRDFVIGRVDEGWYDEKRAQVIREAEGSPPSCKGCALNGRCVNYCGCVNYRTTGKLNEVSPFLCEHEKMLFPIVDDAGNRLFKQKNELFLQKFYNPSFSVLSAIEECIP